MNYSDSCTKVQDELAVRPEDVHRIVRTAAAREKAEKFKAAWAKHAQLLTNWTMNVLVSRYDTFGTYYVKDGEVCPARAKSRDGKPSELNRRVIYDHWCGSRTIGLYAADAEDKVRCLTIDIDDVDGPTAAQVLAENRSYVNTLLHRLECSRLQWVCHTSNDRGGYHVRVPFLEPVDWTVAHGLGHWLTRDFREKTKSDAYPEGRDVEVFPKGAVSGTQNKCGNFSRLVLPKPNGTEYPLFYVGEPGRRRWERECPTRRG